MDFKQKFKTLLQKEGFQKVQKVLSPTNPNSTESQYSLVDLPKISILPVSRSRDSEAELRLLPSDPDADELVLNGINPLFYTCNGFDPSLHELQNLPDPLADNYIRETRKRILKELTVVSKRVFQLILEKQSSYAGEIERVRAIEDQLRTAVFVCQESRTDLALTKAEFTSKSLRILSNYKKRQVAINLLKSLRTISTLQKTEVRLRELLAENDYPGAIQLLLECQQAAATYNHFQCISELSKKLTETLEAAEEQLDVALSRVCTNFDEKQYGRLQRAYELLGKTHTCVDQLLMHYSSAIHNTAFSVVHGFAELCRVNDEPVNLQKKQYQDLCSCLTQEIFIPCLVDLCKAMWKIVQSYYQLLHWHQLYNELPAATSADVGAEADYVDQKLSTGCSKIWQEVQTKVRTFLLSFDFTGFKMDEFMHILSIIHRVRLIGLDFCESDSESLQECIQQASRKYFLKHHQIKLDELRIFLENEGWEVCPVRNDFDFMKLHEFRFLLEDSYLDKKSYVDSKDSSFQKFASGGSPFDLQDQAPEEDIYSDNSAADHSKNQDSAGTDPLHASLKDLNGGDAPRSLTEDCFLVVTNTSLSVLRVFGKYLNLMHLLKSIAYDVAVCMSQLFEYYIYVTFLFFGSENGEVTLETISNAQLRVALTRIRDNLIKRDSDTTNNGKVRSPIAHHIHEFSEENVYGLRERIVASESAVYLALQLERLKPHIRRHVPESNWESIAQLFDMAIVASSELRKPIFAGVTCKAADYSSIADSMEKVNWEVKDLMSQHSVYVDHLLLNMEGFSLKLAKVSLVQQIPEAVQKVLWEQVFKFCCRMFVDGFSSAKKCSNSGRGLMQLDFTQFLSKVEQIAPVPLKLLPDREYVDSYVKAYYLPDTIMEEFIQTHSEYTPQQLKTLVQCALQGNKRSKQKLLSIIEDSEKSKK